MKSDRHCTSKVFRELYVQGNYELGLKKACEPWLTVPNLLWEQSGLKTCLLSSRLRLVCNYLLAPALRGKLARCELNLMFNIFVSLQRKWATLISIWLPCPGHIKIWHSMVIQFNDATLNAVTLNE